MSIKQRGFTLIELLVVIAIIAILSTVVMSGINSARAKSRDARRISDIKMLQKGLELYMNTCGGYPVIPASGTGVYADIAAGGLEPSVYDGTCDGSTGQTLGDFMPVLPVNPTPGGADYQYCSMVEGGTPVEASCDSSESASYQITFTLESETGSLSAGPHVATATGIQ